MFCARYFTNRAFAPRYFAKVGAESTGVAARICIVPSADRAFTVPPADRIFTVIED